MATKYDISNDRLLGDELFVYINMGTGESGETADWQPLAYSTTCSLNLNSDTIDASNKMAGVWTAALPGKLSWTISTEALMSTSKTGYSYFYDKLVKREPFKIRFGQATNITPSGSTEPDFNINESKTYYEGEAYCSSCNLNADNGAVCTMSVEFTGNGALTKTE